MRFLADMGISRRVTQWLRAAGHDVMHLGEEGLQRLSDIEVFSRAARETRTLLTFDLDFGEVVALLPRRRGSVILFRLHDTRSENVISRLRDVLRDAMDALEGGAIVVVEETRHRIRRLPPPGQ